MKNEIKARERGCRAIPGAIFTRSGTSVPRVSVAVGSLDFGRDLRFPASPSREQHEERNKIECQAVKGLH